MDSNAFVRVYSSENSLEIGMIREFLESQGFRCLTRGEHEPEPTLLVPNPIELAVAAEQAEEAAQLVREFRDAPPAD